jgi:hypothetical protein
MEKLLGINSREQAKRQQIVDSLLTNLETFRAEATKVYNDYNPKERALLDSLEANDITSYNILAAWEDELQPLRQILHNKLSESTFRTLLVKNLVLKEEETQPKIEQIIAERNLEILNNFVLRFYPIENNKKDAYKMQREQLTKMLSMPEFEIEQLRNHQVNYMLYKEIAAQNHVTVVDSHVSLFKRIRANARIRAERKKTINSENERLSYIDRRIKELSAVNNGLLVDIFNKKWDLMVILNLRNQYDKKVGKLSETEAKNAIKRLTIFDAETLEFKIEQTEKIIANSDQVNLETTREITKDIDSLLLRIFDLTTIQKNQLLLYTKEYRELTQEKVTILSAQNNRH